MRSLRMPAPRSSGRTARPRWAALSLGRVAHSLELGAAREPPQPLVFELSRALGRNPQRAAGLPQRARLRSDKAETQLDHVALGVGQAAHQLADALFALRLSNLSCGLGPIASQQISQRCLAVLADWLVEARDRAVQLPQLGYFVQR